MNIIQKFRNNTDCYADTWHSERGFMEEGDVVPAMTEERFVKVVNEILSECQKTIEPDKDDKQALHIARVSGRFSNSWNFAKYFEETEQYKRLTEVQKVEKDRIFLTATKIYDWLVSLNDR